MTPLGPADFQRVAASRLPPNLATQSAGSDSPEQPAAYRGRWGAPQATNIGAMVVPSGVGGWMRLDVSVPTILRFLLVTSTGYPGAGGTAQQHFILYSPNRIPESDLWAQTAVRGNVIYLSNPGTWWIKVSGALPGAVVNFLQIDASDPLVAAHYLSIPGQQKIYYQNVAASDGGTGAAVTVFAANPWRTALVMHNPGGKIILYRFSSVAADDPVGGAGAGTRRGIQLGPGATAVIVGDVLTYERLRTCLNDASPAGADDRIEAWEYRMGIA